MRSNGGGHDAECDPDGLPPFPGLITRHARLAHLLSVREIKSKHTFFILLRRLINDCTMLQAAQVKHAHATISSTAGEDVDGVSAKSYVVYLLVVCNQLRFRGKRRNIPDGAGRINARRDDQTRRDRVPVKRGDRSSMLRRFRIRQQC